MKVSFVKKAIALCMCFTVLFGMTFVMSANAAASATVTDTADKADYLRGDTVVVTAAYSGSDFMSMGVSPVFDKDVFSYVSAEWVVGGTLLKDVEASGERAVMAFSADTAVSGAVFKLTLKVLDDAAYGSYEVAFAPTVKAESGADVTVAEVKANVTVKNPAPSIIQKGRNLVYKDMIYVLDIFDVQNADGIDLTTDAGLLVWSVEEYEALTDIAYDADHAVVGLEPYGVNDYYYGKSNGIFTRDLHEEKYYAGYLKLADGSYVYSEARLYSPAAYAYNMLGKSSTSQATKDLCVALLNYISAAQKYFDSTTSDADLVNYDLTVDQKAIDWETVSADINLADAVPADKEVERDRTVFEGLGKNLLFKEMISLISVYKIDDATVNGAKECGTIFWTADQLNAITGTPSITNYGNGVKAAMKPYDAANQWYSQAPAVAAKDMADAQYYTMGYVIHQDNTVSYSGISTYNFEQYIYNTVNGATQSDNMKEFAKRLFVYERAAKAAIN